MPAPHMLREIVEVRGWSQQQRVQQLFDEHFVYVLCPQIMEETVDEFKIRPQEQISVSRKPGHWPSDSLPACTDLTSV